MQHRVASPWLAGARKAKPRNAREKARRSKDTPGKVRKHNTAQLNTGTLPPSDSLPYTSKEKKGHSRESKKALYIVPGQQEHVRQSQGMRERKQGEARPLQGKQESTTQHNTILELRLGSLSVPRETRFARLAQRSHNKNMPKTIKN